MIVVMVAAGFLRLVAVIVAAAAFVTVRVVMIVMRVIVVAAIGVLRVEREQIEQTEHAEAHASPQHHVAEDAIRRQVGGDAAAGVKVEHHAAPEQEHGDAEQMDESA